MLAKHYHNLVANRWWMVRFWLDYKVMFLWFPMITGLYLAARIKAINGGIRVLIIWTISYAFAYTFYRIDLYLWYLSPMTLPLAILPVYSFYYIYQRSHQRDTNGPISKLLIPLAVFSPFLVLQTQDLVNVVRDNIYWTNTVELSRAEVAQKIIEEGSPSDVIATGAIGIVGWKTQYYIWDVLGLVTRNAVGLSLDESLAASKATWCITEIRKTATEYPKINNYALVGGFRRGEMPITFLLYKKGEIAIEALDLNLTLSNGITIKRAYLDARSLTIEILLHYPVDKNYKFFVHIKEATKPDGDVVALYDYYPIIPTSEMKPGTVYENLTFFPEELPPGTLVHLGLFDENDPNFTRLKDVRGKDGVEIIYNPVEGSKVLDDTKNQMR